MRALVPISIGQSRVAVVFVVATVRWYCHRSDRALP